MKTKIGQVVLLLLVLAVCVPAMGSIPPLPKGEWETNPELQHDQALIPEALVSADPEGALIALLERPTIGETVAWLLGDAGGERAVAALERVVSEDEAGNRPSARGSLFLLRLRPLAAEDQVAAIAAEFDAVAVGVHHRWFKARYVARLMAGLGDLRLPQGVEVIRRLADLYLGRPEWLESWVDPGYAIRALDQIDDPAALPSLERLWHELEQHPVGFTPRPELEIGSEAWWRWKLRSMDPSLWPQFLSDTLSSPFPSIWHRTRGWATEVVGMRAAVPLREVAADRTQDTQGRCRAIEALMQMGDTYSIPLLVSIAKDETEDITLRTGATFFPSLLPCAESLDAVMALARWAVPAGEEKILTHALSALPRFEALDIPLEDLAFVAWLANNHPSERIRARAALTLERLTKPEPAGEQRSP